MSEIIERLNQPDAQNRPSPGLAELPRDAWKMIAEHANDYFLILDLDFRIVECSKIEKGYSWEELENQSLLLFVDPAFRETVRKNLEYAKVHEVFVTYEIEANLREAGDKYLLSRAGPYYENGELTGIILYLRDTTLRGVAEKELKLSEDRYRMLFENSPVPLWLEDLSELKSYIDDLRKKGISDFFAYFKDHPEEVRHCVKFIRIIDVNQATLTLLKATGKPDFFKNLDKIIREEALETFGLQLAKIARGDREVRLQSVNYGVDGVAVPVEVFFTIPSDQIGTWSEVIVSTVDITLRKKAEEEIARHQQYQRQLSTELTKAEDSERRRIATQLHDDVGQMLALTSMKLARIAKRIKDLEPRSYKETEEADDLVQQVIRSVRSLTTELSSPVLYEIGFKAAVMDQLEKLKKAVGLEFEFNAEVEDNVLSEALVGLLFRAIRELILNVMKHAHAKNVRLNLSADDLQYQVTFSDDGMGFDKTTAGVDSEFGDGFGLFSITEQLTHIGGNMSVKTAPGEGTNVTITVPL